MKRVFILGGTAEARELAARLHPEHVVVSSLAGRVTSPRLPVGAVVIGGFGGSLGLARWLWEHPVDVVVDATHPFAAKMSEAAAEAAGMTGIPLLGLRRPGWTQEPGDDWRWVSSLEEAARSLPGRRVFLTTGRRSLPVFDGVPGVWFLARSVDPPDDPVSMEVVLSRGPYTLDGELALMREHRIDTLVTKDSGGELTRAKLLAARELGVPVVMVRRPPVPPEVPYVETVAEAADWVRATE
ncbi:cobalt-precorrin-6A reductase [Herbidospora cretacea]|uniref:cobalt-precorrin-6A reductase n=1 Tax=Herbidospora cretacea TaxID=28444 RepID=UPI0004C35A84|nr:cobalt-precorrin-6A reductase [Herbidospora cretacea]